MQASLIKNQFDDVLAVQVTDYDFESGSIKDIISLIREYGLIFWKRTNVSLDVYNKWQLRLGYHQYVDIWCSHEKYPIFMKVTNNHIRKGQKGLFEDQELDWHCNILFTPDSEELLGLYCAKNTSKGSKTLFANSLPYSKNLSIKTHNEYDKLWLKITGKIEDTYDKTLAHHSLPKYQSDDFDKKRKSRDIRKSVNFENQHFNLYKQPRYLKQNHLKLVPKHPIGMNAGGIYFPHLNVERITDSSGITIPNHKKLYTKIKEDYILSGRYVYQHEWEEGDIVLADQLTGVHKRNNVWKTDPTAKRELLRSACWYKTDQRKHFDRSI